MISVGDETPNNDAEGIELHLHPETLKKLKEFMIAIKDKMESGFRLNLNLF